MNNQQWTTIFEKGFPLETPLVLLPWNKPLKEIARLSGGVWQKDRHFWMAVVYLQGLNYPLAVEAGSEDRAFREICAYIGLTPKGWSDAAVFEGYDRVAHHLTHLFGEPIERQPETELGEKSMSWQVGRVHFYLNIIDQFSLKCYLTIQRR